MALIPATIAVTWTSIFNGQHRVCFRKVGAPSYTCTTPATHPSCLGGGQPCSYDIDIMVDNETCEQCDFEGYVQAACEDEVSLVGRIPFAVSFIPDPACNKYDVTCETSGLDSIIVDNPGSGYAGAPAVTIAGGGGAGATATATLGDGIASTIGISGSPGVGYTDGAHVAVPILRNGQVGTTGAGLTADVTVVGGVVTVVVINTPGAGYDTADNAAPLTLDETHPGLGVPGTEVDLQITCAGLFIDEVFTLNVTAPGAGYTSVPSVIVDAPGAGVTALGTAVMIDCTSLTITDCSGVSGVAHPGIPFLDTVSLCGSVLPSVPAGYSVIEDPDPTANCLCTCEDVDLSSAVDDTTVRYIDCDTGLAVEVVVMAGAGALNVCIVIDSLTFVEEPTAIFSKIVNGPCDGV